MITLPKELYNSELIDLINDYDEDDEIIRVKVLPNKYTTYSKTVAHIIFCENNEYYIDQFYYNLKDETGNEMVNWEVTEVLVNVKNYLDILGFKDITLDE